MRKPYIFQIITAIFIVCQSLIYPINTYGEQSHNSGKVTVILRYDDYSANSPKAIDKHYIDILKKYNVPSVFAVIPFAIDKRTKQPIVISREKIQLIKEMQSRGLVEIAMHGYLHKNRLVNAESVDNYSEFIGVPKLKQKQMIVEGLSELKRLFDANIITFVPPWNNYDELTLAALKETGIRILSASMEGPCSNKIGYMPCTSTDIMEIEDDINRACRLNIKGSCVVILLHPYDFKNNGIYSLAKFDALIGKLTSRKDITFSTFTKQYASGDDFSEHRFVSNQKSKELMWTLPGWFRPAISWNVYLPAQKSDNYIWQYKFRHGILLAASLVVGLLCAMLVNRFLPWKTAVYVWFIVFGLSIVGALVFGVLRGAVRNRELVLLVFASGILIYAIIRMISVSKRIPHQSENFY
ncbi:MAG: DUF2334 domain-containing protein [Armatimonadota bacterium]